MFIFRIASQAGTFVQLLRDFLRRISALRQKAENNKYFPRAPAAIQF